MPLSRRRRALPLLILILVPPLAGCAGLAGRQPVHTVEVIAHRGASALAPENTLAAFTRAADLGADAIELDCRLTRDGQAAVIHDAALDRVNALGGEVASFPLAELQTIDVGSWFGPDWSDQTIPSLGQALDLARDRGLGVYIEMKAEAEPAGLIDRLRGDYAGRGRLTRDELARAVLLIEGFQSPTARLVRRVVEEVRARGMEEQVLLQSFSPIACAVALHAAPELPVFLIGESNPDLPAQWPEFVGWARALGVDGINVAARDLTWQLLHEWHDAGARVGVWTVDDPERIRAAAALGVDAITTNRPEVALRVVGELGLRARGGG